MKKLLIIMLCTGLLLGCRFGSSSSSESSAGAAASNDDTTTDATTDIKPDEKLSVEYAIVSGNILYFYAGEFTEQENINPKPCGNRCFTDGAEKVYYDEMGEVLGSVPIYIEPDFIVDDWIVENIEPAQALELGALRKDYTRFFDNGSEVGSWFLNQFKTDQLKKTNTGEIIAISGNTYYSISSEVNNINHANKLLIYDYDAISKTALIDGEFVTWNTNYFNSAKQWLQYGGTWYSWNGYEFDNDLRENANSLWSWNAGEKPVDVSAPTVIAVGIDEFFTYWIECNTGWLVAHLPLFDQITPVFRLYQGDGLRMSGIYKSASLKPFLENGILYFNDSGLRKIDLGTGETSLVFGNDSEVFGW